MRPDAQKIELLVPIRGIVTSERNNMTKIAKRGNNLSCVQCGTVFYADRRDRIYCSRACVGLSQKKTAYFKCCICGIQVETCPSRIGKRVTCGSESCNSARIAYSNRESGVRLSDGLLISDASRLAGISKKTIRDNIKAGRAWNDKRTSPIGERQPGAVLTDEIASRIKQELSSYSSRRVSAIARAYGVSVGTIMAIRKGRTWRHV